MRRARWRAAIALVFAASLLVASAAEARKFQMTGSWAMRRGRIFVPLQFAVPQAGMSWVHTSAGQLSKALLSPNGPVIGAGEVTATGSAPATLLVPQHRFGGAFSAVVPFAGSTLVQITSMLAADAPAAPAALAPGGGPGSFTWCPDDPGCVDPPGTADPPGPFGLGRIVYRAGANQFGGVMRMLLQGSGSVSFLFDASPFRVGHVDRPPTDALDQGIQHTGGPYANTVMDYLPRGFATQPLVPPTISGLITAPGARLTTMLGVTGGTGPAYPTLRFSAITTTPMGLRAGTVHTHTGFPFTTGTVVAQQSVGTGGTDFFTVMGSDMRTALGAGNIALAAGGLTTIRDTTGSTPSASFGVVRMTLSPAVPSLSPAGLVTAALLVVLGVGYGRRRA